MADPRPRAVRLPEPVKEVLLDAAKVAIAPVLLVAGALYLVESNDPVWRWHAAVAAAGLYAGFAAFLGLIELQVARQVRKNALPPTRFVSSGRLSLAGILIGLALLGALAAVLTRALGLWR